ncbi:hypothetical protein [Streptomyces sp. NPDC048269]|uniref:esterase/lipase family protein n=1 Tax=Streptomyces sp. NPDC048269 TaxID=3155753 RepID=UPI00342E9E97
MSTPVVNIWDARTPGARSTTAKAPTSDATWRLEGLRAQGTAWVYYSSPDQKHLRRPVILADGFSMGASSLDMLWDGLENGQYPFVSKLREQGFDVILLGFDERSASILDNAELAIACIRKAIAEREGSAKLTVGGFSMGGLVTRYALAKMETNKEEHETSTYLSYDTPHRGAWLPIAVQAFAHFVKDNWGDTPNYGEHLSRFSHMVNSPAARQLLRWHIATVGAEAGEDQERTDFLEALERVGTWPQRPRLLGVANGVGTGVGNGIPAGTPAMISHGEHLGGTHLDTQAEGSPVVAQLCKAGDRPIDVSTRAIPDIDGAPGGLFPEAALLPGRPANFGTAAMLVELLEGQAPELVYNATTFVPTVSAVATGDIDNRDTLYSKVDRDSSELHDFACAGDNQGHTVMTEELGQWIVDQLR